MTIGDRIKYKRKQLNMTQTELASRMGLKSKTSICSIETNRETNITIDRVADFAEALDCTESYLMGWTDEFGNDIIPTPKEYDSTIISELDAIIKHLSVENQQNLLTYASYLLSTQ